MKVEDQIWKEWDTIESALGGDVLKWERTLEHRDSATLRRTYCRAVFAYADGIAGWMKRYTILLYHPGILGDTEKTELERREGALRSVFKALGLFTDTAGALTPLTKGSTEWVTIHAAIRIRNRVTHVEKASDVLISDADLADLQAVRHLITELVFLSLERSAAAMLKKADLVRQGRRSHKQEALPSHRASDNS